MSRTAARIPVVGLFGEQDAFPDAVHVERIRDRAARHRWAISPHRHDRLAQAFVMERGAAEVSLDGEARRLESGGVLYVPARIVHGFDFEQGAEGLVLTFTLPVLESLGPDDPRLTAALARPIAGPAPPALPGLCRALAQAAADTGPFRAQRAVALAHAVLATLAETAAEAAPARGARGRLQRLDTLIALRMAEGWRPRDYAGAMSISTGQLSRICREGAGCAAGAYVERAVMTEACRLLAFTRLPVAEAGRRLGYADPAHFSRRFRVVCGESPSAFRARLQGSAGTAPAGSGTGPPRPRAAGAGPAAAPVRSTRP